VPFDPASAARHIGLVTIASLADAEAYLDGFINRERQVSFDYEKLGLGRIRALLAALGTGSDQLPSIHVTGSKGKGSCSLASEVLLRAAGVRTGTFTSPHLVSWRERFRVDGEPVGEAELVAALGEMQPVLERLRSDAERCPSFFDVTTALAFELFRRARVEAGIFEVGIGGRLDSTNVVASRASVLTTVELEHTDKLGNTLEAIAREKAGIMRPGVPFLHGPLHPEALAAVMARAVAEDTPTEEVRPRDVRSAADGVRFRLPDGRQVASPVLGAHQATNLALAVRACEAFLGAPLADGALGALSALRLPARVERIGDAILDCAHTTESARALRRVLEQLWPGRRWVLALCVNRDKDAAGVLSALAAPVRACVVTRAEPTRSWRPQELAPLARAAGIDEVEVREDPIEAVARAQELAGPGDLVVATGSFYFAGAVRDALLYCAAP
jgi:dihydrofolate synthase/folylpolyglutamate synthase